MLNAENVILVLKVAVGLVTLILFGSLAAIATGRKRLHGRMNTVFFVLTLTAVLGLEVVVRLINPDLTSGFSEQTRDALQVHLYFSIPSAIVLPFMLYTGKNKPKIHKLLSVLFALLWAGTFITGMFFLPHSTP